MSYFRHIASPWIGAVFAAMLFMSALFPSPALAATCPASDEPRSGGLHHCFVAGSKGHVHTWRPSNYDASTAITVIYVHGYAIDESVTGQFTPHYVSRAWDSHRLPQQFAASGLNALFVAVEGPVASRTRINDNPRNCTDQNKPMSLCSVQWTSLGDLLSQIGSQGPVPAPERVVAVGHSAGMFTIERWIGDSRLGHIVSLDSMYGGVPASLTSYLSSGGRRLTLAGGSAQNAQMRSFVVGKNFTTINGYPSSLDASQKAADRVWFDSTSSHMSLVTGGTVIPLTLQRAGSSAASQGGASSDEVAIAPRDLVVPRLNIPIPNVSFSAALQSGGNLSLPFIGEYVSGVYTLLVGVVGLIAGFMIVIGGFQYLTAGGDAGRVSAAKGRILNALIGIVLVFGSYLVLYTINPALVDFETLQLQGARTELFNPEDYDPGLDTDFSGGALPETNELGFSSGAQSLCRTRSACETFCRGLSSDRGKWPQTTPGYMPRTQTERIPDHSVGGRTVLKGRGFAHPKVIQALIATAEQMTKDHPTRQLRIEVGECHRTLESQISKVCDPGVGIKPGVDVGSAVAWPGGSNHGVGYACDLRLFDGSSKVVVGYNTRTQCGASVEDLRLFDAIMFRSGWVRYEREVWHYEYGTPSSVGGRCGPGRGECSYPPAHYCK